MGLHLVPFPGIAFLWFIGVVRDQIGAVEDGGSPASSWAAASCYRDDVRRRNEHRESDHAVRQTGVRTLSLAPWALHQFLISVYAMRMAAVFTL